MCKAVNFSKLFFTVKLLHQICAHTNAYAWNAVLKKSSYGDKQGAWIETTPDELYKLSALNLYCGLVNVISRDRFKELMGMLRVADPIINNTADKLQKVNSFLAHMKNRCKDL